MLTAQLLFLEDVNHAYLQEGVLLPSVTSRRLRSAKKAQKDAAEKREKDKQASLFQAMKDWEAKHGDISQFDASKVDVMSIHEQVALNVSSAESKYHKM